MDIWIIVIIVLIAGWFLHQNNAPCKQQSDDDDDGDILIYDDLITHKASPRCSCAACQGTRQWKMTQVLDSKQGWDYL